VRLAMALWFAALLGLIQGLTEFIPVSSTAHLKIARVVFGQHIPADTYTAYIAVLQLGTLAAVLVYFAKDLFGLASALLRAPTSPDARLLWLLVVGTVPIVVAGLLLRHHVENLNSMYIIAGTLIGVGIVMAVIDQFVVGRDGRTIASFTFRDALLVGLAQTLALVPGVSRSGSTICMALLLGFTRSDAARFSFLLSIPAVAGAGILEATKAVGELGKDAVPALGIGLSVAGVTGYITIAWLLRFLGSHQLVGFAIYRVGAGILLFAAIASGWIAAI
jgi:undecaprenyl-diphosphatase